MDAFNVLNHINPGNPSSACIDCIVGGNAGVITGEALRASPRNLQFASTSRGREGRVAQGEHVLLSLIAKPGYAPPHSKRIS